MKCGLLGGKLGHSYSPQIHSHLGSYSYELYEKQWKGYKKITTLYECIRMFL